MPIIYSTKSVEDISIYQSEMIDSMVSDLLIQLWFNIYGFISNLKSHRLIIFKSSLVINQLTLRTSFSFLAYGLTTGLPISFCLMSLSEQSMFSLAMSDLSVFLSSDVMTWNSWYFWERFWDELSGLSVSTLTFMS